MAYIITAQTPNYILSIIFDNFWLRKLVNDSNAGSKVYDTKELRRSLFWVPFYGIQRLMAFYFLVAKQTIKVRLVDDAGVVITCNHPDEVQINANQVIWMIKACLEDVGLMLSEPKTKLKAAQICIGVYVVLTPS